ncbi:hypothetical protein GCM10020367_64350 [Streptomyces sannanensis]|uniref:Uncharacterized protein n=1 Tax=Streptomyces sannanensis TaxID=285536 RepID=A0ABP6SLX3_9ACTN
MSHMVLALGAAVISGSGCVWFVPAVVDLRAGDDRLPSRRFAAWACVTGWATGAALALVLLVARSWQPVCAVAAAGAALTATLAVRARTCRRREEEESIRRWKALRCTGPVGAPDRSRAVFLAWALSGLLVAGTASAAVIATAGHSGTMTAALAGALVCALFLLLACMRAVAARGRAGRL